MTYPLILVPFVVLTGAVTLWSMRRPGFARRMRASAWTTLVLVALTAVFDNVMIAAGLFSYPPHHLSGLKIGLAPLEDFAYPICAAFLVPAVFSLVSARREPA